MTLPAQNQRLVDQNGRIDPHWRRYLQSIDTLIELLRAQTTDELISQLEGFRTELETLESQTLSRAEFTAIQGQAETELNDLRDTLDYLGGEVKEATQTSTAARVELLGQNEQRVQEINSLVAKTNTSNASIVSLSEVVATNQAATATQFSSVQTELDGNSASITDLSTSVDGISATRTISVNSNNAIDGYVQISGEGGVSDFTVVADSFKVFHPNSGEPIPILATELDDDENPVVQFNGTVEAENLVGATITGININGSVITGALFQSPGGGIVIDGRDEDNLSITLGA